MDMIALGAAGVAAALCAVVVRQRAPEIAVILVTAACVLLLWNTLPLLETIRDVLEELADLAEISPTVLRPMLQTVGWRWLQAGSFPRLGRLGRGASPPL